MPTTQRQRAEVLYGFLETLNLEELELEVLTDLVGQLDPDGIYDPQRDDKPANEEVTNEPVKVETYNEHQASDLYKEEPFIIIEQNGTWSYEMSDGSGVGMGYATAAKAVAAAEAKVAGKLTRHLADEPEVKEVSAAIDPDPECPHSYDMWDVPGYDPEPGIANYMDAPGFDGKLDRYKAKLAAYQADPAYKDRMAEFRARAATRKWKKVA